MPVVKAEELGVWLQQCQPGDSFAVSLPKERAIELGHKCNALIQQRHPSLRCWLTMHPQMDLVCKLWVFPPPRKKSVRKTNRKKSN